MNVFPVYVRVSTAVKMVTCNVVGQLKFACTPPAIRCGNRVTARGVLTIAPRNSEVCTLFVCGAMSRTTHQVPTTIRCACPESVKRIDQVCGLGGKMLHVI